MTSGRSFVKTFMCVLLVGVVLCMGCTRENEAKRVLGAQGYKDIKITGYRFFGCDRNDTFHTGFSAINPNGSQRIEGVVCSGWFKGSTIRFD